MQVFWHRRDLRAVDNVGLSAAADGVDEFGEVVPVFVFDEALFEYASDARMAFVLDSLDELRTAYRENGSGLVVRRGDPTRVVADLAHEVDAERVVWNRAHSGIGERRDDLVRDDLAEDGVDVSAFSDTAIHEPGEIRTNAGDPYQVYTYFWKKWRDAEKPRSRLEPESETLAAGSEHDVFDDGDPIPSLEALGFAEPTADVPSGGRGAGLEHLEDFCADDIFVYDDARNYPARDATSRLSPHLRFGTLGPREVFERTQSAMADADGEDEAENVEAFQQQLAWREFYLQVLAFNQDVVTENYTEYEHAIEWRDDPEELDAWRAGETGYPLVDAGMRQLAQEAWMHNRVRMVVASFLTKDLLADWRHGYAHFRDHLVDHDTANDNGGWQWAASTGTDAQPYFRVFNPQSQLESYDPDAEYVKAYVPELRDVPAEKILDWVDLDDDEREALAPDYPAPIVDHSERREEAIAMFERARGDD
ncbi:cryptochrome/photolyase family protein [Halocalculus aciditolerans]|uniref:Deoxyribodipyrimidine photo-lyase n=1 Tax=Halocalculus aciditolerans TaxID=1383812 RepID=A0A830FHC0_9EURY|nr:deoxyribodipyrimidine photo-lyase [Halocalculus aciditolerans]GGL56023.1 deoxyribodipyrimidine photo-lyase [Halocalculus aciditolerans]